MTLSGARSITVGEMTFRWKARMPSPSRYGGWSPKTIRLVVLAPGGASFTTTLISKNWLEEHERDESPRTHKAEFTPRDVRLCIYAALRAGWGVHARNRQPFVLDPPPEGRDYGPADAPRNLNPKQYGKCPHGVLWGCSDCDYYASESYQRELRPTPIPPDPEKECCLVCFKPGKLTVEEVATGRMPERFHQSPWRIVRYVVEGREGFGAVCSPICEGRFYALVQNDVPNLYERIFDNLVEGEFDDL